MTTLLIRALACAAIGACGVYAGLEYSRQQIRDISEEMAAQGPTNSFTRCLTELWEQSGELDGEWKGKRRWLLTEEAR